MSVPNVCNKRAPVSVRADSLGRSDTPVPVRLTIKGVLLALVVRLSVPVRTPAAVGVKLTMMVQFAELASVSRQNVSLV